MSFLNPSELRTTNQQVLTFHVKFLLHSEILSPSDQFLLDVLLAGMTVWLTGFGLGSRRLVHLVLGVCNYLLTLCSVSLYRNVFNLCMLSMYEDGAVITFSIANY